ncbi:MAG: hypothetical protein EP329_23470 [Deltaproteobacteria bacterium]|nr:MAG: hypothetical protein EP329_23470 [Deltaproteobacteria bacterium]
MQRHAIALLVWALATGCCDTGAHAPATGTDVVDSDETDSPDTSTGEDVAASDSAGTDAEGPVLTRVDGGILPAPPRIWFESTQVSLCSVAPPVCENDLCAVLPTPVGGYVEVHHVDADGGLWISTAAGTYRLYGDGWTRVDSRRVAVGFTAGGVAFGWSLDEGKHSHLLRSDGGGAFAPVEGAPGDGVGTVFGTSPTDLWVGYVNTNPWPTPVEVPLYHWDGLAWTVQSTVWNGSFTDGWAASSARAWVTRGSPQLLGEEELLVWDGVGWQPEEVGLSVLRARSGADLWALGPKRVGLYHSDGAGWTLASDEALRALALTDDGAAWTWRVGDDGLTLARWSTGDWSSLPELDAPFTTSMVGCGDAVWLGGGPGLAVASPTGLCGVGAADALVVEAGGQRFASWTDRARNRGVIGRWVDGAWEGTVLRPRAQWRFLPPGASEPMALVHAWDDDSTAARSVAAVLRWSAGGWVQAHDLGVDFVPNDACAGSAGSSWVAGAYRRMSGHWVGRLVRFGGGESPEVTLFEAPVDFLGAVAETGDGDVWVVGHEVRGSDNLFEELETVHHVWRWHAEAWSHVMQSSSSVATDVSSWDVVAGAADDVWLMGPGVPRWQAGVWTRHCPEVLTGARVAHVLGVDDVVVGGDFGLLRFDGETWRRVLDADIFALQALADGSYLVRTDRGVLEGPLPAAGEVVCATSDPAPAR